MSSAPLLKKHILLNVGWLPCASLYTRQESDKDCGSCPAATPPSGPLYVGTTGIPAELHMRWSSEG